MSNSSILQSRIELDSPNYSIDLGEKITGKLYLKSPLRLSYRTINVSVVYQTRGRGNVDKGVRQTLSITKSGTLEANQEHVFDFSLSSKNVVSYNGKNLQILWEIQSEIYLTNESKSIVRKELLSSLSLLKAFKIDPLKAGKVSFSVNSDGKNLKIESFKEVLKMPSRGESIMGIIGLLVLFVLAVWLGILWERPVLSIFIGIAIISVSYKFLKKWLVFMRFDSPGKVTLDLQSFSDESSFKYTSTKKSRDLDLIEFSISVIEEVRYSRGSDSETFTENIHTEVLKIIKNPQPFHEFRVPISNMNDHQLPASFKANSNEIIWNFQMIFRFSNGKKLTENVPLNVSYI